MFLSKQKQQKLTKILFALYLILLAWIILFKMQFSLEDLYRLTGFRMIYLVPFEGTVVYDGVVDFQEIMYNVLIFVPFGIYISILKPDGSLWEKVRPIAGVSLFFEVSQYLFMIGSCDITDFLGNTLGGALGIGVYFLFQRIFKTKAAHALNLLALMGTAAIFIFGLFLLLGVIQIDSFS